MTDDEMNAAVAKCEGFEVIPHKRGCVVSDWLRDLRRSVSEGDMIVGSMYEPATNWNDCGPLVNKYELTVEPDRSGGWMASAGVTCYFKHADTPQRAICLAVLTAHEVPA